MADDDRQMNLHYAGKCTACGAEISAGTFAVYRPSAKTVNHISCPGPGLDRGSAGGSAYREFERRTAKDRAATQAHKERVADDFGDGFIGKVATFLAVDDRPRLSTQVWAQGAVGEERVGSRLDALRSVGVVTLHDRRIRGSRANIDHIAITPWGVWVVDAKRYLDKRPDWFVEGGFFGIGGTTRLRVGGRNRDSLVDGVQKQVALVKSAVGSASPVRGALCFVEADWPLIGGSFSVRGVEVFWPNRLAKTLLCAAPPSIDVDAVTKTLAAAFPPA